jgi:hypothetical protein
MQDTLNIELIPDVEIEAERLGFDDLDGDDINITQLYFEQGLEIDYMEVSPGETFTIPLNYKGKINNSESLYEIVSNHSGRVAFIEDGLIIMLGPAELIFEKDGKTIRELGKLWP